MTRRIIATVVVLIVVAVAIDWTFWYRFATIRDQTSVSIPGWISPTAAVEGDFREELAGVAPADRVLSPGAIAELVDYAEQVESFSLIVHHGGAIQFETYWREYGPDDATETLSMAKSVLGLTFGFAVEEGSIGSIDDPVTEYIPEWDGTDKERLTIRHVLQMASGLEIFRSITVFYKILLTKHFGFLSAPAWRTPFSVSNSRRSREANSTTTAPTPSCSC